VKKCSAAVLSHTEGGITCRFFADLHGFRKLLKETEELRGGKMGWLSSVDLDINLENGTPIYKNYPMKTLVV